MAEGRNSPGTNGEMGRGRDRGASRYRCAALAQNSSFRMEQISSIAAVSLYQSNLWNRFKRWTPVASLLSAIASMPS